jgi:hypothetical protein
MSWRLILAAVTAVLVAMPMLAGDASAQRPRDGDRGDHRRGDHRGGPDRDGQWELLGSTRVGRFGLDRDTVDVGRREGKFRSIGVRAKRGGAFVAEVTVVFGNGRKQRIELRQRLREGERSRPIDLKGDERFVKRIEISARARRGNRGPTVLEIYGEGDDRRPPRRAHWEELGCQKVGFGADKDTIKVGRREGRFDAIRLQVKRSDVLILSLRVIYARGAADDFDVQTRIRAGEVTRPFDLRGERRAIDRIELVYTSIPSFKGSATLCAEGRQ